MERLCDECKNRVDGSCKKWVCEFEEKGNTMSSLYLKFRQELDEMIVNQIINECMQSGEFVKIEYDNKVVGFLSTRSVNYIDGIYVLPEYRGLGLATGTVRDYLERSGLLHYSLHIIKRNKTANDFWGKIFPSGKWEWVVEAEDDVDILWEVTLKAGEQ